MATRGSLLFVLGLALAVLSGCATSVRTPAPVVDRERAASQPKTAVAQERSSPQRREEPGTTRVAPPEDGTVRSGEGRWPAPDPAESTEAAPSAPAVSPSPVGPPSKAPAVVALVSQADDLSRRGNTRRAAAALERALRLEPRNPRLWHELARLRCKERRFEACESLAAKSLRLDRTRVLEGPNWLLVAVAREGRGDLRGARQARQRAAGRSSGVLPLNQYANAKTSATAT